MRVTAVVNQKGGVGKTTTVISLASWCAHEGKSVLVIDMDSQANATTWLRGARSTLGTRQDTLLYDALSTGADLPVVASAIPGVDLVPSSGENMAALELRLATEVGGDFVLRRALDQVRGRWDLVFIDCPPSLGKLVVASLVAAQDAIVPIEPQYFSLSGLLMIEQNIDRVREHMGVDVRLRHILLCKAERTNLTKQTYEAALQSYPSQMLKTTIRKTVKLNEVAGDTGTSIFQYAPESTGAADYQLAAEEILQRY